MADKSIQQYLVEVANDIQKAVPATVGGLVVLWENTDTRLEDVTLLLPGSPKPDTGQDASMVSEFSTSMSLFDAMQKNEAVARIVQFACREFNKQAQVRIRPCPPDPTKPDN